MVLLYIFHAKLTEKGIPWSNGILTNQKMIFFFFLAEFFMQGVLN